MPKSTSFAIRQVPHDDPAKFLLSVYAFDASPREATDKDREQDKYLAGSKSFMSFDGETPLAKVGILPMTMNVRGKVLPMGGIGGVATMPAGRRGGRIRALMTRSFEQMREDDQPVSTLYPFRESFYERLGYVSFPAPIYLQVNPADLAPLMRLEHAATIEHMVIADGFDAWIQFLQVYQSTCHGFSLQGASNLAALKDRNKWWLTLVRENGDITGAMTYRIPGEYKPMHVGTFYATTVAARYRLLEWIGRHTDQIKKAQIPALPGEHPELWWHDMGDKVSTRGTDAWGAPMGRVVSIDGLAGIPVGDGDVTIAITDAAAPWNTGTWTLRGRNGVLDVEQGGTPTGSISIQGFSSVVFNGTDPETIRFRGWGDIGPEMAAQFRALFPPALPFLHEKF